MGCNLSTAASLGDQVQDPLSSATGHGQQVFADIYTMGEDILGEGSFGKVRPCSRKDSGEDFAVKIFSKIKKPRHADPRESVKKMVNEEIGVLKKLHSGKPSRAHMPSPD